jgi:hypothetical protein
MSEQVFERKCHVALIDGPKDGWVYEFPMHWEVREGVLVWEPPAAITTDIGEYVWDGDDSTPFTFRWRPSEVDRLPLRLPRSEDEP